MTTKPTVAVVDDDTMVREHMLDARHDSFVVTDAFANVESLLSSGALFDVVVLDMWIRPLIDGAAPLRGAAAIKAVASTGARVVVYTGETRELVLVGLFAYAKAIVSKAAPSADLYAAIVEVTNDRETLSPELVGLAELARERGALPQLAPRHLPVLRLRARGLTWDAVAAQLNLAKSTVQDYGAEIHAIFANLLRTVDLDGLELDDPHSMATIAKTLGLGEYDLLHEARRPPH